MLMIAAGQLQTDIVSVLVKKDANVNMDNKGNISLHKAIAGYTPEQKQACKDIVHKLQKLGATPKGFVENNTPLHTAIRKGSLEVVDVLSKYKGTNENKDKGQEGRGASSTERRAGRTQGGEAERRQGAKSQPRGRKGDRENSKGNGKERQGIQ